MKRLSLLLLLSFAPSIAAPPLAIFGKDEKLAVAPGGKSPAVPDDKAKAEFLAAFLADLAHPGPFAPVEKLSAPPEWGKTVAGAQGSIEFHPAFKGGFVVRTRLAGLAPHHRYILTLNGNPKLAGNDLLIDPVPGLPEERFFDFLTVTTGADGSYEAPFGILLKTGLYHVRYYVKDTDDFKIVLYRDYFKFQVE